MERYIRNILQLNENVILSRKMTNGDNNVKKLKVFGFFRFRLADSKALKVVKK